MSEAHVDLRACAGVYVDVAALGQGSAIQAALIDIIKWRYTMWHSGDNNN